MMLVKLVSIQTHFIKAFSRHIAQLYFFPALEDRITALMSCCDSYDI